LALQCVPQRRAAAAEQAQRLFARRSLRGTHTHSVVRKWSVLRYRATGRGFVVRHESFSELFRFYATSHFYKVGSARPPVHIHSGTGLTPATSAPGLRSPLPHRHRHWARPCHICTGTGLTPATSAPGPGSQAIEILSVLVVYYIVAANIEYGSIGLLTWSMWFVAFCWFFTPFWFNPLAFDWSKTLRDFEDWTEWMKREVRALHSTVQPVCAARSHCA
jgi:hypothetical protein